MIDVDNVSDLSYINKDKINDDTPCGCYHCLETFKGSKITQWYDMDQTAVCPKCGIDSIVPNITNKSDLEKLQRRWFYASNI